jgi:hypothetical protein
MHSPLITLYTTFYNESNIDRKKDLEYSIFANLNNPSISKYVILNEDGNLSAFKNDKLLIITISKRPTYSDFFNIINKNANSQAISIVANTDISFDKDIEVLKYFDFSNTCIALSRWNILENRSSKLYNHNDSQDVWIFKGSIKTVNGNFNLGTPRCDNRILYELKAAGYIVSNPAFSIKAYHNHKGIRTAYADNNLPDFVDPPYAYLYPHNQYNLIKTWWFNFTHNCKLNGYRYDIKKVSKWILVRFIRKCINFH